jgi:hypothetical protein
MTRRYYTLAVRLGGMWSPQFGDYTRATVSAERDYVLQSTAFPVKRKDTKIVASGDSQDEIEEAVAALKP